MKRVEVTCGDVGIVMEGFDDPMEIMAAISAGLRGLKVNNHAAMSDISPEVMRQAVELVRAALPIVRSGAPVGADDVTAAGRRSNGPEQPNILQPGRADAQDAPGPSGPSSLPIDEAMLERIFDWANQLLATPEALGRRDAMASLRAAVASTNAARRVDAGLSSDEVG